ncbi:MAG TPA: hypothetical protein VGP73_26830 [Thermoanaerobaculia bacterium]
MRATAILSRFLAVVLLCIPLAWGMAGRAQRNLDEINAHPDAYLQHARSIQQPSFWPQLFVYLILLGVIVFAVEGVAYLIRLCLPRKKELDRKTIGTTFE